MSIDPTARLSFIHARIIGYLQGLTITGSPTILVESTHPVQATRWARVTFTPLYSGWSGRYSSSQIVADSRELVTVDLFWPSGDTDAAPDLYEIDRAAEEIAHGLRSIALSVLDYTVPAVPTVVPGARIFAVLPPTTQQLDPQGGLVRRQVTAEVRWYLRHTA